MFTFVRRSSNVYSFTINVVRRSLKKSFTQFNNSASTLLFRMLCSSRACETLSNVSDTFKLSRDVTFFFELLQIVWTFFVINSSTVSTNRCFLTLICVFDSVTCVSTTYRMRSDIIDFNVLLNVFNSAIDLYDCQGTNMNREHMLVWVISTRILAMLWSRYMREGINTTTKSKYTRVSRLVSSRDKSHEQIYRLKSWQYSLSKICASFDESIFHNFN